MLIFTDRELQKAWRDNKKASEVTPRQNPHRLLLFYAVECGLKAVLMKRSGKTRSDLCSEQFTEAQHNLNHLLDFLGVASSLRLPKQIKMSTLSQNMERKFTSGEINQMWRYGGKCAGSDQPKIQQDQELEKKLVELCQWIEQELK